MCGVFARNRRKLYEYYSKHFSPEANIQMRVAYLIMVILVTCYTIVVVCEGMSGGACRYERNRKSYVDDDLYINPEFSTYGGCLRSRFWFLLFMTPEECMLCRRILLSVILGMMIGFERRRADRPAGVRTMSLVSLGSCVFTIDSMFAFSSSPDSWDSSRVAAAIPSGVGFLGAGLIYKQSPRTANDRHEVHGLTTASSVWLSAAAGIAAGGGLAAIAFFSTCTMLIVLRFGPRLSLDESNSRFHASSSEHGHSPRGNFEEEMTQLTSSPPRKLPAVDPEIGNPTTFAATAPIPSESAPLVPADSPLRPSSAAAQAAASSASSAFKKRSSSTTGSGGYYSAVADAAPSTSSSSSKYRGQLSSTKQPSLLE